MKYFSYSSTNNQMQLLTKIAGKVTSKYVPKTNNVIIIGSHGSGKTRMVGKFAEHAAKLYKRKKNLLMSFTLKHQILLLKFCIII